MIRTIFRPYSWKYPYSKKNYWAHCVEGGAFIGSISFADANTLLPSMIQSLGGPTWLMAYMPVIMTVGFTAPPIFTAHLLERINKFMPLLKITGIIQRAPYLLAALFLLYFSKDFPIMSIWIVAAVPLISGIFGGIGVTAWQRLLGKTIPPDRRSSVYAIRFIIAAIIGIAASEIVEYTLEQHPGPKGYSYLHFYAFFGLCISFLIFCTINEQKGTLNLNTEKIKFWENIKTIPYFFKENSQYKNYLFVRFTIFGIYLIIPFMAVYAREHLSKPEHFLGELLFMQTVGIISGNIISGFIGDRYGNKFLMILARIIMILMAIWLCFANNELEFKAIFFLLGFGLDGAVVGTLAMALDLCPKKKQSTFLSTMALASLPGLLIAPWLSSILWDLNNSIELLSISTIVVLGISIFFTSRIKDPRKTAPI